VGLLFFDFKLSAMNGFFLEVYLKRYLTNNFRSKIDQKIAAHNGYTAFSAVSCPEMGLQKK